MQFELSKQKVKLAHMNARSELNGEDRAPAADLKLEMALGADSLAMFGPDLRSSWYTNDAQQKLRNPQLEGPFGWESQIVGATLTVHVGLGGKSDLVIVGCTVNSFKLTPQDGGTVLVSCRVQCHPDEKSAGRIYGMIQSDVEVSLEPAQGELKV